MGGLKTDGSQECLFLYPGKMSFCKELEYAFPSPWEALSMKADWGSRLRETSDPAELLEAAREALQRIPEAEPIHAEWKDDLCLVELRLPGGCRTVKIRR